MKEKDAEDKPFDFTPPEAATGDQAAAANASPDEKSSDSDLSGDSMLPFDAFARDGKRGGGLFGRLNDKLQDFIQTGRGSQRLPSMELDLPAPEPVLHTDDEAIRHPKSVNTPRALIVPEGAVILGSIECRSETEISGRVEGDVRVEGRLHLGSKAEIKGSVRATSCRIDGRVEGRVESSTDVELGRNGQLLSEVQCGRKMMCGGKVSGGISCGGSVRLLQSARVEGDIQTREIVIEEGAVFNGACKILRAATQRSDGK